jgi:hypothetical protein
VADDGTDGTEQALSRRPDAEDENGGVAIDAGDG